jgi:phytoene/squalene synthetase
MDLYTATSYKISKLVTESYSTSFSFATSLMNAEHRSAIYAVYGFVRFADEIVDTFHSHDKEFLLNKFEKDLHSALEHKLSLNPILHSFQQVVNQYNIPYPYIEAFLNSMRADLEKKEYATKLEADQYIYGSADVVGLMCLKIFCDGDKVSFKKLQKPAMRLGSAFQKVNFLRDLKNDAEVLGRSYFPDVDYTNFTEEAKYKVIAEIEADFDSAYLGIKRLPQDSKIAVLVAYLYYKTLLKKLKKAPANRIQETRMRISDSRKIAILLQAILTGKLRLI